MYITLKSIKRNLGFKGIEIQDVIIALPIVILFIVFLFQSKNSWMIKLQFFVVALFSLIYFYIL